MKEGNGDTFLADCSMCVLQLARWLVSAGVAACQCISDAFGKATTCAVTNSGLFESELDNPKLLQMQVAFVYPEFGEGMRLNPGALRDLGT